MMGLTEELQEVKQQRSVARGKFTRKLNLFNEGVERDDPEEVQRDSYDQVCKAFNDLESHHEKYVTLLITTDESESELVAAENYMIELERKKSKAHITLVQGVSSTENEETKCKVKLKALEPPKFSGNVRDYPRFKLEYERLMTTNYGTNPYALKQCLTGEALDTVKGVDNDYIEMFKRLNQKYGNTRKLVDAVVSDLKSLKMLSEGDAKNFISMVDKVEACWLDLKQMKLETEMNTASMVSHIERILPPTQKREWVIIAESITRSDNLFKSMLEFLLKEKRVIEYMNSNIRMGQHGPKGNIHTASVDQETDSLPCAIKEIRTQQEEMMKSITSINHMVANMMTGKENDRNRKCWLHSSDGHDILECVTFQRLDNLGKVEALYKHGICFKCLKGYHTARNCPSRKTCDVVDEYNLKCNRAHHSLLHQAHTSGQIFHNLVNDKSETALLMVNKVLSKGQMINTLWDPGSDKSLITNRMASKLGLKGKEVTLSLTKIGNQTDSHYSKEYNVPLTDKSGNLWTIKAYGIEEITSELKQIDLSSVSKVFKDLAIRDLDRPHGNIDLLVGTDCCVLLPQVRETVGNLQLMESQFGICLRGSHPYLTGIDNMNSYTSIRLNHMAGVTTSDDFIIEPCKDVKQSLDELFTSEHLNVNPVPKCGSCRCGKCHSDRDKELNLIDQGLEYDSICKRWTVTYPWIKDPQNLPDNRSVAVARMKSTERRLNKLGAEYVDKYQEQMEDMIVRKVARKLTKYEMIDYKGPIHYVQHHEVMKESSSTPLRIVFNSSASYMGHVLNDYWAKGPDLVNNLLDILMRFRQEPIAIFGDISKMYNTIRLNSLEQQTHRFVWRDMETYREPDHYVLMSVPFGDRPSGTIATLALRHTVDMNVTDYPEVAEMIHRNTYVDDILQSCDDYDYACKLMTGAERSLAKGGFAIKGWIMSGVSNNSSVLEEIRLLDKESEKVLGMMWNPKEDIFSYKSKVNFSPRYKKQRTGPDLNKQNIVSDTPVVLTRRMVLSQAASLYDPLGLIVPFTLTGKVLMRELIIEGRDITGRNISWDEPLSEEMRYKWISFFSNTYDLNDIKFDRCIKPSDAKGNPILIVYSDASSLAYGACAYIRWEIESGGYVAKLFAAKNRIAPIRQVTIPRLELCGAVTACRLREKVINALDWKFDAVFHLTDSAIVKGQIQSESTRFNTYVATRVAEIQNISDPSEWLWVGSNDNPADLTTRPCKPKLLSSSTWQNGPDYLTKSIEYWPISQTCTVDLPEQISINVATVDKTYYTIRNVINISRYSSYNKLIKVTARLLSAFKGKSFKEIGQPPTQELIKKAEIFWIKDVQRDITVDWQERYKRLGPSINGDGIIVVGQRIERWLRDNWNRENFALLTVNHPFTMLYVTHLHNIDHAGVEATLSKLHIKYWVPAVRKLIKSVKHKCIKCKKLRKETETQAMGQVIKERLKPSPPFCHTAVDLFGPFQIRDNVKRRVKGKAYGVVFNCLSSRAMYIDLAEGYDTQSFLSVFRRFVSIHGFPSSIHSDSGTQLVSANNELKQMMQNWDTTEIMQFGSTEGMSWSFNKSADAPWQNGCSESLIKLIKRSLTSIIGDSTLTFGELQTVFFEIANLLNERPIGMKPGNDIDLGTYLCPNDLLLGRASSKVPQGPWKESSNPKERLAFLENIVNSFWRKWQRDYFHSLLVRQKWHVTKRNLRPGDIVLVQDTNLVRGKWKLAEVKFVNPGRDNKVRDVTLRYKPFSPGIKYTGLNDIVVNRSVHKLIVLIPIEERHT